MKHVYLKDLPREDLIGMRKKSDFKLMLELIELGLWRDNNLAKVLHVAPETIGRWKLKKASLVAHRNAVMKALRKGRDNELILKELEVETEVQQQGVELKVVVEDYASIKGQEVTQVLDEHDVLALASNSIASSQGAHTEASTSSDTGDVSSQ